MVDAQSSENHAAHANVPTEGFSYRFRAVQFKAGLSPDPTNRLMFNFVSDISNWTLHVNFFFLKLLHTKKTHIR